MKILAHWWNDGISTFLALHFFRELGFQRSLKDYFNSDNLPFDLNMFYCFSLLIYSMHVNSFLFELCQFSLIIWTCVDMLIFLLHVIMFSDTVGTSFVKTFLLEAHSKTSFSIVAHLRYSCLALVQLNPILNLIFNSKMLQGCQRRLRAPNSVSL